MLWSGTATWRACLVIEVDRHLLVSECVELVTDPLADRIRHLVAVPVTAHEGARP